MFPLFACCTLKKASATFGQARVYVCKKLLVVKLQHLTNSTSVCMKEEPHRKHVILKMNSFPIQMQSFSEYLLAIKLKQAQLKPLNPPRTPEVLHRSRLPPDKWRISCTHASLLNRILMRAVIHENDSFTSMQRKLRTQTWMRFVALLVW